MKLDYCEILENKKIKENIYEISIFYPKRNIKPGQFFMIKSLEGSYLLPRPISVYDYEADILKLLYKIVGKGTKKFSELKKGEKIQILGPLGNGFELEEITGRIALVGGGIGIAPLNLLAKKLQNKSFDSYLGFKDEIYAIDNFKNLSNNITVATETGNFGEKGYITDYINVGDYDTIIICGPEIMMIKIISLSKKKGVKVLASLEKRMACGIGACLGCSIKTTKGMKRVCKEGPVFLGEELLVEEIN